MYVKHTLRLIIRSTSTRLQQVVYLGTNFGMVSYLGFSLNCAWNQISVILPLIFFMVRWRLSTVVVMRIMYKITKIGNTGIVHSIGLFLSLPLPPPVIFFIFIVNFVLIFRFFIRAVLSTH